MNEAVLELVQVLARGIDADESCADQVGAIAADARLAGDHLIAAGLSALARNHRIRALELRGRLAVESQALGGIFHQNP